MTGATDNDETGRLTNNYPQAYSDFYEHLDSMGVDWTSINPLAYANEEEAKPFCPFVISVGVTPRSLAYEDAVAAAGGIKEILTRSGLSGVEVAFVESVVKRSVGRPKLLPFNPLLDDVPEHRKHFTSTLGLHPRPPHRAPEDPPLRGHRRPLLPPQR